MRNQKIKKRKAQKSLVKMHQKKNKKMKRLMNENLANYLILKYLIDI